MKFLIAAAALAALGACSDGANETIADRAEQEEGLAGASSGPNPNLSDLQGPPAEPSQQTPAQDGAAGSQPSPSGATTTP